MNAAELWMSIMAFGLSLICVGAGCLIWFVRLEGKVNTLSALHGQFRELVSERHIELGDRMDSGFRDMKGDLNKIFDRLEGKADKTR